jgi:hypothetical protein
MPLGEMITADPKGLFLDTVRVLLLDLYTIGSKTIYVDQLGGMP